MSDYETFMIMLTFANLIVAILTIFAGLGEVQSPSSSLVKYIICHSKIFVNFLFGKQLYRFLYTY